MGCLSPCAGDCVLFACRDSRAAPDGIDGKSPMRTGGASCVVVNGVSGGTGDPRRPNVVFVDAVDPGR